MVISFRPVSNIVIWPMEKTKKTSFDVNVKPFYASSALASFAWPFMTERYLKLCLSDTKYANFNKRHKVFP